jgi:hypothetical protein
VGIEHYDGVGDTKNAEFYREKIMMLFRKPSVIQEFIIMQRQASNEQDARIVE